MTRETSVTLVRDLKAPLARVWAAWTEPEQVSRWSSPAGLDIVENEADLRPGGAWRCVMRDGIGRDHILWGAYREIVEGETLVFTWNHADDGESLVTVQFEPVATGTRLTLTHARLSGDSGDIREGWTGALDKLEALLTRET